MESHWGQRCVTGLSLHRGPGERPLWAAVKSEAWLVLKTLRVWRCVSWRYMPRRDADREWSQAKREVCPANTAGRTEPSKPFVSGHRTSGSAVCPAALQSCFGPGFLTTSPPLFLEWNVYCVPLHVGNMKFVSWFLQEIAGKRCPLDS